MKASEKALEEYAGRKRPAPPLEPASTPPWRGVAVEALQRPISEEPVQLRVRAVEFWRPFHLQQKFGECTLEVVFQSEPENDIPSRRLPIYYNLKCLCSDEERRWMLPCPKARVGARSFYARDARRALEALGQEFDPYERLEHDLSLLFPGILWLAEVVPYGHPPVSKVRRLIEVLAVEISAGRTGQDKAEAESPVPNSRGLPESSFSRRMVTMTDHGARTTGHGVSDHCPLEKVGPPEGEGRGTA